MAMNPHHYMACWECVEKYPNFIGKVRFPWHKHVVLKNADTRISCNKCIKTCPLDVFSKLDEVSQKKTNEIISQTFHSLIIEIK